LAAEHVIVTGTLLLRDSVRCGREPQIALAERPIASRRPGQGEARVAIDVRGARIDGNISITFIR
jgi:hypothetical protein